VENSTRRFVLGRICGGKLILISDNLHWGAGEDEEDAPNSALPLSRTKQFVGQSLNFSGSRQQPKIKKVLCCIY